MEPWVLAIALRPLAILFMFGCVAMPISLLIRRFIPDGRTKQVLYDRNLMDRPLLRLAAAIGSFLVILTIIGVLSEYYLP